MTIRLLTACLLPLFCLLARPTSAQEISPLPARVVRLDVGDVFRVPEAAVAMDTATYYGTRRYQASAGQLLLVRADRIAQLERDASLRDSIQVAYAAELRRCQAARTATEGDYDRMRQAARVALASPPRPPLLLDAHFYEGTGAGALLLLALKLFIL